MLMHIAKWIRSLSVSAAGLVLLSSLQIGCEGRPVMRAYRDAATGQYYIVDGNRSVLRYNYATVKPPAGYLKKLYAGNRIYAVPRSDYIHPLFGPNGEQLTLDWSVDHPHHRGIYWAWPEVQYQGQTGDLHALQRVFARPTGKIELSSGARCARIKAENRWMWQDKIPVVRELVTICAWKATDEGRYVDLTFTFTALVDGITLARRGTTHYGGLNIRLAPVKNLKLIHHTDPPNVKPREAWQAATGTWAGGKPAVLAVFEKKDNPEYPGDYVEYPKLPWFQPTFPKSGSRYALKKGQPLTLRYRLWICACPGPTELQYRKQWNLYQNTK